MRPLAVVTVTRLRGPGAAPSTIRFPRLLPGRVSRQCGTAGVVDKWYRGSPRPFQAAPGNAGQGGQPVCPLRIHYLEAKAEQVK